MESCPRIKFHVVQIYSGNYINVLGMSINMSYILNVIYSENDAPTTCKNVPRYRFRSRAGPDTVLGLIIIPPA